MTDSSGTTTWAYDARGRLSAETKQLGGSTFTTSYSYRSDDRPQSMTYPDGELLSYTYDAWGRPQGIGGVSPEGAVTGYVSAAAYNANGQVTSLTYGNGVTTSYTYHAQSYRLTGISAPGVLSLQYSYDNAGNVQTITDGGQTTTFAYDALDRLTSATGGYTAAYSYSPIGNLLSKTEGAVTRNLVYPAGGQPRPHAPLTVDGAAYTYDLNGNLTARPGQTLTYDAENRLTQVISGTATTLLTYDGDGNLVKKVAPEGTTLYIGSHYEVFASANLPPPPPTPTPRPGLTHKFALPVVLGGCGCLVDGHLVPATKYYLCNGQRVALRQECGGAVTYLYHDHLGSTVATSTAGKSMRYWPYGAARTGDVDTPYRYTGQRLDSAIGLYYCQARFYDPALGRFIQPDTIVPNPGNPQDLNRFSYCRNNPQRYTDPTGRYVFEETPDDPWVYSDARVRSRYWYTHPEARVRQVTDADVVSVFAAPPLAAVAAVGGEAVAEVVVPVAKAFAGWATGTAAPLAQKVWERLTSGATGAPPASPWSLPSLDRGQVIEDILGRNLVRNFPVIDRWENGVVTSIKSVDLGAATYQEIGPLTSRVQGYIQSLANYQGQLTRWGGVRITPEQITARTLQLAIPPGASTSQMGALQVLQQSASRLGVSLQVVVVP